MLRPTFCSLVLILAFSTTGAVAEEFEPESKIDSVLVFPSGAEIVRTAKISMGKGDHTVIFGNLPLQALPGSIRVEGKATGNLKINSVDSRRAHLAEDDKRSMDEERRRLKEELQSLKDDRDLQQGTIDAAETQRNLINNLANLPARPAPIPQPGAAAPGEDWQKLLSLIGESAHDVNRTIRDAKVRIRELNRKIKEANNRLSEIAPQRNKRTEVKVYVSAETPLDADLIVRYQVSSASWKPFYDARLSTGTKTITPKLELTRRATITQRTGEPWIDVEVSLSTTRPKAGASAPDLNPITVDFWQEPKPVPMAASEPTAGYALDEVAAERDDAEKKEKRLQATARKLFKRKEVIQAQAQVAEAPFQAVFRVPGRVSVKETGEPKKLQILSQVLDPELSVKTVPKVDAKAYLYSKLTLPRGAPLMPGPVSLFRDGTFVGNGKLPVLVGGEDHELGFGVDDLVRIRHRVLKDNKGESGGLISVSQTENKSYLITLKNLHERAIAYQVLDQIPYSKNEEIVVQLTGKTVPTEKNVDNKRGILAWKGDIAPDEEQAIEFGYRVSWPGDKRITYQK